MTIVLADGCFDLLHVGHVRYLKEAKAFGDKLIVRVAPDEDIRKKGHEPYQTQRERMEMVAAIHGVDLVVEDATLESAVNRLTPHVVVKGPDQVHTLYGMMHNFEVRPQIRSTSSKAKSLSERLART